MNNFAISSDGIASGLQRSASTLVAAGNSLEQSIAMLAAGNKVIQDPETLGNALKVLSMRIRGVKSDLEDAGEETDGMIENTSKLRDKVKALTNVDGNGGVDILTDSGEFRSTYDILLDIAEVWDRINETDPKNQAALLEILAGKTRGSQVAAILQNPKDLKAAYETAMNSAGSAMAENEKYLDSIQGRIDLFTNSLQTMWMNFINSDAVKFIVDLGAAAVKLVDTLGVLPTVIGGFTTFKTAAKEIKTEFEEINKAIRDTKIAKDEEDPVVESTQKEIQARKDNSNAIEEEKTQTDELTTSKTLGTAAGWKDVIATNAQIVKTKALAVAKGLLKGVLKGVVAMLAAKVIGAAFSAIYKGIDNVIHRAEKIKEEVTDLKKTYEDAKKTFDDNLTTLTTSSDTSVYATLQDEFNALTKGVDKYGNNISLTSDQYERYKSICEKIVGIQPSIAAGYDSATKAIGQNASVLSELIELQKIQARQNTEQLISDENFSKIVEDAKNDYKNVKTQSGTSTNEAYSNAWNVLSPIVSEKLPKYYTSSGRRMTTDANFNGSSEDEIASYILEQIGYTAEEAQKIAAKYYNQYNKYFNIGQFMADYSDVIKANTEKFGEDYKLTLDNTFYDIEQAIASAGEDVKEAQDGLVDDFLLVPQGEKAGKYYDQLNDASKKFITDWIKNSDQFKYDTSKTLDENIELAKQNKEVIINMIKDLANADSKVEFEGQQITGQDLLDQYFNFDPSTVNWEDYKAKMNAFVSAISKLTGIDEADVKVALNIDFEEKEQNKQTYIKQIEGHIDLTADQIQSKLDGMNAKQIDAFYSIKWNKVDWGNVTSWQDVLDLINKQAQQIETVVSVKTYADLQDSISNYNDILSQTSKIILDNTEVTQDYKDALVELGISEEDLADCFDESNGLVVKNAKALNNLVKSSKSNIAQNVSLAKTQARLQYYELYKKIKTLTGAQGELAKANVQEINALYKEMGTVEQTITKYSMLEQQLLGAAGAYQKYEEAKTIDEEKDYGSKAEEMVSSFVNGLQSAKLGTEEFKAAVQGLIPENVYSDLDTVEEKVAAMADYLKNSDFSKYFTLEFGDDGTLESAEMTLDNVKAFIESGLSEEKGVFVGQDWQHFELSDDIKTLDDFCEAMNLTKEMAFAMFTEIDSYDAEWLNGDFGSIFDKLDLGLEGNIFMATKTLAELDVSLANNEITVDEWAQKYQEANNKLQGCAEDARKNAVEYQTVTEEVSSLKDELDQATKKLNELNQPNSGSTEQEIQAQTRQVQVLSTQLGEAIKKKYNLEEPTEMSIQLALDDIESQMDTWKANNSELAIKTNVANIDDSELVELGEDGKYVIKPDVELTEDEKAKLQSYLNLLNDGETIQLLVENDEEAKAQIEEVQTAAEAAKKAVEAIPDPSVDSTAAISSINRLINAINKVPTSLTVTTTYREVSEGQAVTKNTPRSRYEMNSTKSATVNGTAHASGGWGLKQDETGSLIGELGPETLVRDGKWKTIGDNGAEIINLKKGDIIFNHKQTEELMKNGHITSRGKMVGGQAHAEGNAHVTIVPDYTTKSYYSGASDNNFWTGWTNVGDSLSSTSDSLSNAADSLSDSTDEFEEVFDWIEVRIEEIDEKISLLEASLENVAYYNEKNNIIDSIIDLNNTKLSNLKAGYEEYAEYAAKLLTEIPENLRDAAQNGAIAIEKFVGEADEATVEAINNYREWAQKAADLKQQAEEIISTIRDLAIDKFNNAKDSGDVRVTVEDSQTEKLQNAVDLIEDKGMIANQAYYTAMMENSNKKIEYQTAALKAAQKALDDAVKAGQIERGSNEWYELVDELYQMQSVIDESTAELEEFQNAINDLYWDNFDELINRIDYLNNQTQSLIDLMDSADMVTKPEGRTYEGGTVKFWTADDVQWTEEGIATLGLYAQQMEIAEYKARQYAEAIDDLQKDYQKGLYSENEYLEKLDELTQNQYDAIESYYDAQDAIKDLNQTRIDSIKDGIQKEIDAYSELIDKKKEELESEKDLYDFQKSTAEQTKNIADIQRKLMALSADNSASAIAKRKQLEQELAEAKADLEDSYYQRSIDDRSNALDKELEDFQTQKDAEIEKWEEYLENIEQVVADSLGIVQANASGIYDTLSSKAEEYNLTLSNAIMTPWQDGALAVSDYQTTFDTAMSSTMDQLEALKNAWQKVIDKMTEAGNANVANINKENANYAAATYTEPAKPSQPSTPSNPTPAQKAPPSVGQTVRVKSSATHFSTQSGSAKMASFVPGGSYQVMQVGINGDKSQILIGKNGQYTGWVWLKDLEGYASGTKKLDKSGIVNIDELGEELVIGAHNGRLTYLEKGSGVIPADLTSNLMKWGELDPQDMLDRNRPSIMPSKSIINNEISINMNIAEVVHIDEVTNDTIPDLTKAVQKQMDSYMVKLNNAIKAKVR